MLKLPRYNLLLTFTNKLHYAIMVLTKVFKLRFVFNLYGCSYLLKSGLYILWLFFSCWLMVGYTRTCAGKQVCIFSIYMYVCKRWYCLYLHKTISGYLYANWNYLLRSWLAGVFTAITPRMYVWIAWRMSFTYV